LHKRKTLEVESGELKRRKKNRAKFKFEDLECGNEEIVELEIEGIVREVGIRRI